MQLRSPQTVGTLILSALLLIVAGSFLTQPCSCKEEDECFCPGSSPTPLHTVTEAEFEELPADVETEYRNFLLAWETEYADRNAEWTDLYENFHSQYHTTAELDAFDTQLRRARRDFVLLFRERHRLFREKKGLTAI